VNRVFLILVSVSSTKATLLTSCEKEMLLVINASEVAVDIVANFVVSSRKDTFAPTLQSR